MSQHDLDLYGSGINWRRATAIFAVMSVIVAALGFFGYRWLTTVTPVSRDQALQMFKAESRAADRAASANSGRDAAGTRDEGKERPSDKDDEPGNATSSGSGPGGGGSSPKNDKTTVAAGTGSTTPSGSAKSSRRSTYRYPTTPEEGVYSWDTEGWEDGGGIRRDFPSETQRIVTESNGSSWKQHHYFSEEREIWSKFVISDQGAHMAMQRNRAKFGPVTNDSTIDFSPPMLVGLADPEVGRSWSGKWRGKTSGSFAARIVDHRRMQIGRESIEVWGYELRLELRGELDGTVFARIMYSPQHALTVQEHYTQDIQSERGRYRAEWRMTLQSTTPQR